jgi:hypothetical protein
VIERSRLDHPPSTVRVRAKRERPSAPGKRALKRPRLPDVASGGDAGAVHRGGGARFPEHDHRRVAEHVVGDFVPDEHPKRVRPRRAALRETNDRLLGVEPVVGRRDGTMLRVVEGRNAVAPGTAGANFAIGHAVFAEVRRPAARVEGQFALYVGERGFAVAAVRRARSGRRRLRTPRRRRRFSETPRSAPADGIFCGRVRLHIFP